CNDVSVTEPLRELRHCDSAVRGTLNGFAAETELMGHKLNLAVAEYAFDWNPRMRLRGIVLILDDPYGPLLFLRGPCPGKRRLNQQTEDKKDPETGVSLHPLPRLKKDGQLLLLSLVPELARSCFAS